MESEPDLCTYAMGGTLFEMESQTRRRLPRTVVALGGVSLLNDLSSEMVYPLLPLFLKGLGASVAFIGLIEGIAETTASLLKLFSGWLADRTGKHKGLAFRGYAIAGFTRPLLALATAPIQVLGLRFVDRVGKGIRTAPRDALIATATPPEARGLAFGFHRAMDNLGATLGPLTAGAVLLWAPENYRLVFLIASIPALASLWLLCWGVKEVHLPPLALNRDHAHPLAGARRLLGGRYGWFLLCVLIFTLSNSSEAFLILKAAQVGIASATVPLLWAGLNFTRTALSTFCGALADRWGRKRMLLSGWFLYALVYAGFGVADRVSLVVALFLMYALYFALTEASERALVADYTPPGVRGQAYGLFHFVVGIGMLPASVIFGALWEWAGSQVAFFTGAGLALLAGLLLMVRK